MKREVIDNRSLTVSSVCVCAAQCTSPPGWPRGDPVRNPVPALQHTEEDTGHYCRQEVRPLKTAPCSMSAWNIIIISVVNCRKDCSVNIHLMHLHVLVHDNTSLTFCQERKVTARINMSLTRQDVYIPVICSDAFRVLCASVCMCVSHTTPMLTCTFSLLTPSFFLSPLKLGRCTIPNPAHRVVIRPGSRCRAHGSPRCLQSRVGGGAGRAPLARQAAHPPGE